MFADAIRARFSGWGAPAGIAGICLLCYVNSLDGSFHYDGFHSIVENPGVRSLANVPAFFWDITLFSVDDSKGMYRPLLLVTYALNYAGGGYGSTGYHIVNLFLHALCSVLVWAIARVIFRQQSMALVSGLLFVVHPLATEPVNYVSSRSELLAGLLYLGSFFCYIYPSRTAALRRVSIILFAGGLLSKATVVTLPLVLIWFDLGLVGRVRDMGDALSVLRDRWREYAPYWGLVLLYFAAIKGVGFIDRSLATPVREWGTQLWTQAKAPAYYAKLMVMPVAQSVEHQFFESLTLASGAVMMASLLVLSLFVILWLIRTQVGGFCLGWCIIFLLPTLIMPLNVLVNERRMYLVTAGLAWLLADLLRNHQARPILACLPLLALLTMARNEIWADELTLWRDAVSKAPAMYRTQTNLGKALQIAGSAESALEAYERALAIDSRHGDVYNNMATLLHQQGRIDDAIGWYRKALTRYPEYEEIHQNLADAYSQKGCLDSAAVLYEAAIGIDDRNGAIWANYGQTLYRSGDLDGAEKALRRSLELLPQQGEPYNNLGNIHADRGDFDQALSSYGRAVELGVEQLGDVFSNIGDLYRQQGDFERAKSNFERAIDANSGNANFYQSLGVVERHRGSHRAAEALLRKAISMRDGYWKAHTELAELLELTGRTEEAIEHFRVATVGDSGYDRAWYGLASAADKLERVEESIIAYESFLRIWPHRDARYREVDERLGALRRRE